MWDFTIQTDHVIQACRPDIIIKDNDMDHTWILDIAVPSDSRTAKKELEKAEKYQDLSSEIRRCGRHQQM